MPQPHSAGPTAEVFLQELLRPFPDGTRAWVTSFPEAKSPQWAGKSVRADDPLDTQELNCYFSTAGFERGARSRRIEEMAGVGVIVVDDPTAKGDAAALFAALGKPSYKIQTSRDNQQWGYFLKAPAGNDKVAPVLKRIVTLGLGDGSGNNAVRYARLPAGINNKPEYEATFAVQCRSWNPELRFTIEEIAAALSGNSSDRGKSKAGPAFERVPDADLEEQIRSGDAYHDPVLLLAGRWISQGGQPDDVKARLRDIMESCSATLKSEARWHRTFDDIDRNVESAVSKDWAPTGRRSLEDFVSHLPTHSYLFTPTMVLWPAGSVDACVPHPGTGDKKIKPSFWLDRHRPVHSMTWSPAHRLLIEGQVAVQGGWKADPNATSVNLYMPPRDSLGDPELAERWTEHLRKIFPGDADHIIKWFAHRAQFPGKKINHALVLTGDQGIGKDTLLEPLKIAVGEWNFQEVGPAAILGAFNGFVKSVVLRVSEARDLGPTDRFGFYEHMKIYTAAPPDTIRCNEKHQREHYVFNVMGVVITTNHRSDGIYLPQDDRRHYVASSLLTKDDFREGYWRRLWRWYLQGNGFGHVAAFLRSVDLSDFDPAAPPPKTPAWHTIVAANNAPEDIDLASAIEELGEPDALTLGVLKKAASVDLIQFLDDHRNRRAIGHRLIAAGYVPVANPDAKNGLWRFRSEKTAAYAKRTLTPAAAITAVRALLTAKPRPQRREEDEDV